jgi:hypothetical protein
MNSLTRFLSLCRLGACLFVIPAGATGVAAEPTASRPVAELKELASVEQFLGLSDAELDQMQQVLARIRAMPPAGRVALRAEIEKYRQLPEAQRQQVRQGWGWMPREIQDAWREMMQNATPERRAEVQTKLQSMEPGERLTYRRQLVEEYLKKKGDQK